nr:MAG TPA: hypothetical protein [Caudoviricetes sp.]DAH35733.1 MAG TPA: hypothetical protein [Caudoviricetes sp.]
MKTKLFAVFLIAFGAVFFDLAFKIVLPFVLPLLFETEKFYLNGNLYFSFSEMSFSGFVVAVLLGYVICFLQNHIHKS